MRAPLAWDLNDRTCPRWGPSRSTKGVHQMSRFVTLCWVLVAAASFSFSHTARAQSSPSSALINQALDKQAKLDLNGTLPDVMGQISKQTGVPIDAVPDVWAILPWGKETTVTAKIENQTLREALEVITRKLGLQFVLKDEAIELQPVPALRRLGRKS